ncbi:MAG: hypothetical protein JJU28_15620 [Cyclobacteriaceae bacterium]|nr:hypothetical protein [Cyclobacteriaceae bacterium]
MEKPDNIPQERFEEIESYLLGTMPEESCRAFESKMQQDKALASEVEELKSLFSSIETMVLKAEMQAYHKELENQQNGTVRSISFWYKTGMAAVISLLLITVSWFWFMYDKQETRLFAQFYEPDPGLITAMSNETNYAFDRAMVDYKSGLYTEAIERWEELLRQKPENDTLQYFLGSSYLALKDLNAAQSYFKKVSEMPGGRFTRDAYWYLALTYLSEGKTELTRQTLDKTDHPSKNALLEALEAK